MAQVNHIEAKKIIFIVASLCLVAHFKYVDATTYMVGDSNGWEGNVSTWPNGKKFKAGDVLVFDWVSENHNLVVVDKDGYDNCEAPDDAQIYTSGHEEITLTAGSSYYICTFPGHCEGGMKIAVNAS